MNTFDRALIWACKHSWTFYQRSLFCVDLSDEGPGLLRIPIVRGAGLTNLAFEEPVFTDVIRRVYNYRRGYFIDVGANTGKILLRLLSVGRDLPYLGFEPNIFASFYVQMLIRENKLRNHSILPVGLSDYCATETLHLNDDFDVSGSIMSRLRPRTVYSQTRPICLSTGDVQLAHLRDEDIAVVKIDAEGCEMRVLTGMRATIDRHRPVIIVEVLPYAQFQGEGYPESGSGALEAAERREIVQFRKDHAAAIEAFLLARNYRLLKIRKTRLEEVATLDQGLAINPEEVDYVAVPAEAWDGFVAGDLAAAEASLLPR